LNPSDILTLLRQQALSRGAANAIEAIDGASMSYARLRDKATDIAASIAGAVNTSDGRRPRIGLVQANGADMALALLGASIAGEATPFNPASKPAEFDAYFRACGIDALIVREDDTGPAVAIAEKLGLRLLRVSRGGDLAGLKAAHDAVSAPAPDDIALVLMTSGSTGKPKIVPLSHRNVCVSAADVCRSMGLTPQDRCLCMWEQYHIGGLVDLLLAPLVSGGSVVVTSGFNAATFFELLHKRNPTWFQGVPTTLNELVVHAGRNPVAARPSSLRLIRSVAAALAPKLMLELEVLFGVPVIQTFGMTEAGPLISSTALPPAGRKPGSVGRSCGPQIRIVGVGGESLAAGETGEVAIRGPNVFTGYENDPDANATQFRDGWFHTGDIGHLDGDGVLFLTGRIKQLINRGGEKISPQEVDDALLDHPAVSEAAAFAIPHPTLGEDVAAAVVLRGPVAAEDLRAFLSSRLAAFKVPRHVAVLERLPRNPVGKIDRLALAEAAASEIATGGRHVPPRNRLEEFLTRLWEKELGVTDVGIYDDFALLGGDSLSSLRVITAVETIIQTDVPDDVFEHFSPIALLAEKLAAFGVDPQAPLGADRPDAGMSDAGLDGALNSRSIGSASLGDSQSLALRQMEASRTRRDFQIVVDALTLYCTPAELSVALDRMPGLRVRALEPGAGSLPKRMRMWLSRQRWRASVRRELAKCPHGSRWRRKNPFPSVMFYDAASAPTQDKTLVVGFAGNFMRLMIPTYRILNSLDPEKIDLLLLSDPSRTGFMRGLEGIGDTLEAVERFLNSFVSDHGYGDVVVLGTSGGGMPAIHAAIANRWRRVVAVGSATPARHLDIAAELRTIAPRHDPAATEIVVAFSSGNSRDSDSASQLKGIFPGALLRPDSRFGSHNLLHELHQKGQLVPFITALLR